MLSNCRLFHPLPPTAPMATVPLPTVPPHSDQLLLQKVLLYPPIWVWCSLAGFPQHWGPSHQTHTLTETGHYPQTPSLGLRTLTVLSIGTVPWGTLPRVICSMGQTSGHPVIGRSFLPKAAMLSHPVLPGTCTPLLCLSAHQVDGISGFHSCQVAQGCFGGGDG